jgi:hypothetical protein
VTFMPSGLTQVPSGVVVPPTLPPPSPDDVAVLLGDAVADAVGVGESLAVGAGVAVSAVDAVCWGVGASVGVGLGVGLALVGDGDAVGVGEGLDTGLQLFPAHDFGAAPAVSAATTAATPPPVSTRARSTRLVLVRPRLGRARRTVAAGMSIVPITRGAVLDQPLITTKIGPTALTFTPPTWRHTIGVHRVGESEPKLLRRS